MPLFLQGLAAQSLISNNNNISNINNNNNNNDNDIDNDNNNNFPKENYKFQYTVRKLPY